jgi:hypothetical protein
LADSFQIPVEIELGPPCSKQVAAVDREGAKQSKKRRGKPRVGRQSRQNCKKRLLAAEEKIKEAEARTQKLAEKHAKLKIMYKKEREEKLNLLEVVLRP